MPVIEDERAEARRMRDEEDKSERDIATALGRAPSTIHKWLSEPAETEPATPDTAPPEGERFMTSSTDHPEPIPGQQTTDGSEVPATQNGNGPHIEEIRVDGTTQLGLIDFGGKQPQSATLRLTGGEYELLEGRAFQKGDVVRFSGTAVVDFVGGKDKTDRKTGIVVSAKQKHTAYITDLIVTGAE